MGTIAYRDIAGELVELSDHEGFVLHESTVANRFLPGWGNWLGYWSAEVDGTFTGRHMAACDCGWRGPVVVDVERTTSYGMDETAEDLLLDAWAVHVDEVAAKMRGEAENPPVLGSAERVCFELVAARRYGAHLPYSATRALDEWERLRTVGAGR